MISYRRNFAAEFYWASTLTRRVKRGFGGGTPAAAGCLSAKPRYADEGYQDGIHPHLPKKTDAEQVWGTVRNNE